MRGNKGRWLGGFKIPKIQFNQWIFEANKCGAWLPVTDAVNTITVCRHLETQTGKFAGKNGEEKLDWICAIKRRGLFSKVS